jgi:hypothetical protein
MLANFCRKFQHVGERHAVLERTLAGALDYWTIRHGITEWHTKLDHCRAGLDCG